MCVFGISIHIALLWSAEIELIAILGLGGIGLPMFYTPITPLGLCSSGKLKIPIYRNLRV